MHMVFENVLLHTACNLLFISASVFDGNFPSNTLAEMNDKLHAVSQRPAYVISMFPTLILK